jgi:uncharacterized membrane protein YbaN (DUF454 family)
LVTIVVRPAGPPKLPDAVNESCPIDHKAAERAAEALPNPLRRWAYFSFGAVSVALGVVGIVVPLWPTTCFLLLAGWCFARSSHRAERWLHENRLFGRYLRDYREKGVISSRIRTTSVMTLWAFMGLSAFLLWERLWIVALLVLIGSAVTVHLFSLPTASTTASAD